MKNKAIYWFRNNLRLLDNPSLFRATQEVNEILPVYIIDDQLRGENKLGFKNCGPFRWNFLVESIQSLQNDLQSIGSDLLILEGDPVEILVALAKREGITQIYTSKEVAYNEIMQENRIAEELQLEFEHDQLLFDINTLPFEINQLPDVFTNFRKAVEKSAHPRREIAKINHINNVKYDFSDSIDLPIIGEKTDQRSAFIFQGGEQNAWERLGYYFWETGKLSKYKNTRNGLIGPDYSSKFSPFLGLGSISPVSIYNEVRRFEQEHTKNISTYWLIFELLWREFFKYVSLKYGRRIFSKPGIRTFKPDYSNSIERFNEWKSGETRDDFVNANMLELNLTGFMSNRGRQNVASYLVHDLNIDWRWGASYFEAQLIDYDCSSNWSNWMYVAGVGNDPRSRKFNTKMQAKKYDAKAKYRNLWLNPTLF